MSLDARTGGVEGRDSVLGDVFYPLYDRLFDDEGDFVGGIEEKLAQARMADNVELFLARALGVGALVALVLALLGTAVGYLFVQLFLDPESALIGFRFPESVLPYVRAAKAPLLILVSSLIFGSIGFVAGFGTMVSIPYFRAGSRKREINVLLSDSISFMYALSVGGMNQLEILQAMAKADDTYGEVSKEFQSIVLETEYFDTDYRTAVRNQAIETPSDELSQFLTDMLSIINSGGDMTAFLEDQKEKHMRTAKQEQEELLDTLELFGEMYMTLSLFPLLLVIILVIMWMMQGSQFWLLVGVIYGLIPLVGIGFLVLVSTVTQDTVGDGYLRADGEREDDSGAFGLGLIGQYTGEYDVFDRIKRREGAYELAQVARAPHLFFRDHPLAVLAVTVPLTLVVLGGAVLTGNAPLSVAAMEANVIYGTFVWVYLPLYLNLLPLGIFYEWNVRSRRGVLGKLSDNLRKLASANDTGMTLLESFRVVADTSSGKLADEFETIHAKVNYGTGLKDALREFNNKYHIPRLARTVKLISKAQETSSQIQNVLSTAAQASENQDDIDRERKSRTRMQMVIIIMTYITLLGVMALLRVEFIDVIGGLDLSTGGEGVGEVGIGGSSSVPEDLLSMLFFHAVTLQAIISSFVAGYIRDVNLLSGVKFAVVLSTVALLVWIAVAQITGGDAAGALLLVGSTWPGRRLAPAGIGAPENRKTGPADGSERVMTGPRQRLRYVGQATTAAGASRAHRRRRNVDVRGERTADGRSDLRRRRRGF